MTMPTHAVCFSWQHNPRHSLTWPFPGPPASSAAASKLSCRRISSAIAVVTEFVAAQLPELLIRHADLRPAGVGPPEIPC